MFHKTEGASDKGQLEQLADGPAAGFLRAATAPETVQIHARFGFFTLNCGTVGQVGQVGVRH